MFYRGHSYSILWWEPTRNGRSKSIIIYIRPGGGVFYRFYVFRSINNSVIRLRVGRIVIIGVQLYMFLHNIIVTMRTNHTRVKIVDDSFNARFIEKSFIFFFFYIFQIISSVIEHLARLAYYFGIFHRFSEEKKKCWFLVF